MLGKGTRGAGLGGLLLVAALGAACGRGTSAGENGGAADTATSHTSAPGTAEDETPAADTARAERVRGELVLGPEGTTLAPCGGAGPTWVVDRTEGELERGYASLAAAPSPLYVELLARPVPPPAQGPGAGYARALEVLELRRASPEGVGCDEHPGRFDFRATGNEPFWAVDVARAGIVFSEPEIPDGVRFPPAAMAAAGSWRSWVSTREGTPSRLEVVLVEGRCADSMSGEIRSFRARVEVDGRVLEGCAREGWPAEAR